MKYKILIEETLSQMFDVEADNLSEARKRVHKDYLEGRLVLEPGELESVDYMIFNTDGIQNITELENLI